MRTETNVIAEIIRWTLLVEGPSNSKVIKQHLISHPDLAFVALREDYLNAKILQAFQLLHLKLKYIYLPYGPRNWTLTQLGISTKLDLPEPIPQHIPWLKFGIGEESVYGLVNPSYMYNLVANGSRTFPIKIGRTNRSVERRIQELQTGSFLDLRVGFQIKTDNSQKLERYLHSTLFDSRSNSLHGTREWFHSDFFEIKSLYKHFSLDQNLLIA